MTLLQWIAFWVGGASGGPAPVITDIVRHVVADDRMPRVYARNQQSDATVTFLARTPAGASLGSDALVRNLVSDPELRDLT